MIGGVAEDCVGADESGAPDVVTGVPTNSDISVLLPGLAVDAGAESAEEQAITTNKIGSSNRTRYPVNVDVISVILES